MEQIERALNAVGFLMATARITNGNLRLQFLKNTYRGNRNNIEIRANGWRIGELLDNDDLTIMSKTSSNFVNTGKIMKKEPRAFMMDCQIS